MRRLFILHQNIQATREVHITLFRMTSYIESKNNLSGITFGIMAIWGIKSLSVILSWLQVKSAGKVVWFEPVLSERLSLTHNALTLIGQITLHETKKSKRQTQWKGCFQQNPKFYSLVVNMILLLIFCRNVTQTGNEKGWMKRFHPLLGC